MDLLSDISSRSSMVLLFNNMYSTLRKIPSLKAICFLSDSDPSEIGEMVAQRKKVRKLYDVEISAVERDLFRMQLKKDILGKTIRGDLLIDTSYPGAWIAFTTQKRYFVQHVVESFFNALYPDVSRIFLSSQHILRLLESIREAYRGQSLVNFFAIKHQAPRGTTTVWRPDAESELQKLSRDHKVWIDRLAFEVLTEERVILKGFISRKGLSRLRFGSFDEFYKNVITTILNFSFKRKRFYARREYRIENGNIILAPFYIKYPFEFGKEHFRPVANWLGKEYSVSITHDSNPYFVAQLCDYRDGSSFGMTMLGELITITPLLRANPHSLMKLSNRIQEYLGEGVIADYHTHEPEAS
jgi:hypothetical protein